MDNIIVQKPAFYKNTELFLPASKSISNRLLVMQFLSDNKIVINNLSEAGDCILMQDLMGKIRSYINEGNYLKECKLDCGNTGTVLRFLTGMVAQKTGKWLLTGSERMKQRPVQKLCDALQQMGASVDYLEKPGFPPIKITGKPLNDGRITIDASQSSQYVSALLMIAPTIQNGLEIELKNTVASRPYIEMTLALMKKAGINFISDKNYIRIEPGEYLNQSFTVEPDWSSASYWFEMIALSPSNEVFLKGLSLKSLQGDNVLSEIYSLLGVGTYDQGNGVLIRKVAEPESTFSFNFSHCPDLVPAVAVTCAALNIDASLRGLNNLRIKESDRLQALQNELSKINPHVTISDNDTLIIKKQVRSIRHELLCFSTYNDHRMAMAFAPLALKYDKVAIENPGVVVKSYPSFWDDISDFGFGL